MQYATFIESMSVDQARAILQRGLHLQIIPPLTYQLAIIAFEEAHGGVDKARLVIDAAIFVLK